MSGEYWVSAMSIRSGRRFKWRILVNTEFHVKASYDLVQAYRLPAPKKLNHPHVLRDGGRGTRSRLHHAVVSSLRVSSALRAAASLILLMFLNPILLLVVGQCSRQLLVPSWSLPGQEIRCQTRSCKSLHGKKISTKHPAFT